SVQCLDGPPHGVGGPAKLRPEVLERRALIDGHSGHNRYCHGFPPPKDRRPAQTHPSPECSTTTVHPRKGCVNRIGYPPLASLFKNVRSGTIRVRETRV